MLRIVLAGLFTVVAASHVWAETYSDTFDSEPQGHWQVNGSSQIPPSGGNPGPFLRGYGIDSIFPRVWTAPGAGGIFTGDYRARQVNGLGLDAKLLHVDFPNVGNRPMTLLLVSDNDTPGFADDDWAAYEKGANIPYLNQGWLSYDYEIPSGATSLPPGWLTLGLGPGSPSQPDWNILMNNVTDVWYWWGDPELFYIFQTWEMGVDNMRIAWVPEPAAALAVLAALLLRRPPITLGR